MKFPETLTYSLLIVLLFYQCKSSRISNSDSFIGNQGDSNEIYLIIGQSNTAGRAEIEEQDKGSLKNVFLFTENEKLPWEKR